MIAVQVFGTKGKFVGRHPEAEPVPGRTERATPDQTENARRGRAGRREGLPGPPFGFLYNLLLVTGGHHPRRLGLRAGILGIQFSGFHEADYAEWKSPAARWARPSWYCGSTDRCGLRCVFELDDRTLWVLARHVHSTHACAMPLSFCDSGVQI